MSLIKYYTEYVSTGNTELWVEDTIYINKNTNNVSIGKVTGTTYRLLVTGKTYTDTLYLGDTPTGTGNDVLILESGQVKKKTGASGISPKTTNFNVQYYYDGILSGDTQKIDYYQQQVLRINRGLNLSGDMSDFMSTPTPVEGDIVRIKNHPRYTDGYYVYNAGGSWVALITW